MEDNKEQECHSTQPEIINTVEIPNEHSIIQRYCSSCGTSFSTYDFICPRCCKKSEY